MPRCSIAVKPPPARGHRCTGNPNRLASARRHRYASLRYPQTMPRCVGLRCHRPRLLVPCRPPTPPAAPLASCRPLATLRSRSSPIAARAHPTTTDATTASGRQSPPSLSLVSFFPPPPGLSPSSTHRSTTSALIPCVGLDASAAPAGLTLAAATTTTQTLPPTVAVTGRQTH